MAEVYPVFDVDEEEELEEEDEIEYLKDYRFDFSSGEFVTGSNDTILCDGADAWLQWCGSVIRTVRYGCLAYSDDIGVELEDIIGLSDREDAELQLETTITEALLSDPDGRTESVEDFSFDWGADNIHVQFTVESTSGIVAGMSISYGTKIWKEVQHDRVFPT